MLSGDEELVSVNLAGNGGGNGHSSSAPISSDARFVVFVSKASDLVANDTNGFSDIFVRDRLLGTTALLSVNRLGTGSGNETSTGPVLSADGRTVAFQSMADDLVDGDYNNCRDVFVVRLGGGDIDGDQMDDDWEMAYFNTLDRDGTGDCDGDGMTDRDEFLAGTDPTNGGSVLRVLTITSLSGGHTMLVWSAVPGRTYQVQYKDSVSDSAWTDFPAAVTAKTQTATFTDTDGRAAGYRFYRVLVAE